MACPPDNSDSCGCKYPSNSNCVTLKGIERDCIDDFAFNGKTLTQGFNKIIDYICNDIDSPSGYTFIVESCNSSIVVTQEVAGDQVIYEVCLNPQVITDIVNNTTNIATLDACVLATVKDIASNTLDVTVDSSNACGRTLRIEYNPSGADVEYDGIVYNNTDVDGTDGTGGDQILKSFNHNYGDNAITDRDEIRIRSTGKIKALAGVTDSVKLEIVNVSTGIVRGTYTLSGDFNTAGLSSWIIEGVLTVTSATNALLTVESRVSFTDDGVIGNVVKPKQMIDLDVSGMDYTDTGIRIIYVNDSGIGGTDNYCRTLMVEVRKKI